MTNIRVRFAPSPTGALHIGGVRTALYNYLLAKKHKGTFILRIEDTDEKRYVPGAENYIMEALKWLNITPDESPITGGDFGPYRQSERKHLYGQYAQQLLDEGHAYYAFDTAIELAQKRTEAEANKKTFRYDASTRLNMLNSLSLSMEETKQKIAEGTPYTIRLKVPQDEKIIVNDQIRGKVTFDSSQVDDKVLLKVGGMPTYHLANVVDDHLMKITHVIRGEEWLPSTAHHVLLYRFLGWETTMPDFAHLPLILKPSGKGKLSKRDGEKLGIPVFPLSWEGEIVEKKMHLKLATAFFPSSEKKESIIESISGFREHGFLPEAVINFLAFLGWNPGTEQEVFSLDDLVSTFSIEKVGKSGARFDFDKAKWFNQQYIQATPNKVLVENLKTLIAEKAYDVNDEYLEVFCSLMKERVSLLSDFLETGYYFFEPVRSFDMKTVKKRWKAENKAKLNLLLQQLNGLEEFNATNIENNVKIFINEQHLTFGDVLPILRIGLSGTLKGPSVFDMMALLGKEEIDNRMSTAFSRFEEVVLS